MSLKYSWYCQPDSNKRPKPLFSIDNWPHLGYRQLFDFCKVVKASAVTEFFCPFCTKSTKIKKDKFIYHLTGKQRGQCQFFVQLLETDRDEALMAGWMTKQLMCETTKSPYDPLLLIDHCKRSKTIKFINANCDKITQLKIDFDDEYWRRVREKSAKIRQEGDKYNFIWQLSMRKHRQASQHKGVHLLGDAQCSECVKFTDQVIPGRNRSARNQLTSAVKSARARSLPSSGAANSTDLPTKMTNNDPLLTAAIRNHLRDAQFIVTELAGTSDSAITASKSSLVTFYQSIRLLMVKGAKHIAPALLKQSSVIRLFVNAANLEQLVTYFRRIGKKAAATKLRDLRAIYAVIGQLQMSNSQTGTFLQCQARLQSRSNTRELSQAARKDKNDSKSRQHLASQGKYIPITDYDRLGVLVLDQTRHYPALTVFNVEEYQTRLLLAMMLNGPCYRLGEWMQMTLDRTVINGGTINIVVPTTKNTLRKGQSAMLKIPPVCVPQFMKLVNFRRAHHHELIFCDGEGDQDTSRISKCITDCVYMLEPRLWNCTPQALRWLQSAFLWFRHKSGGLSLEKMEEFAVLLDRDLQTWQENYAFSDDVIERPLSNANAELLQSISAGGVTDEYFDVEYSQPPSTRKPVSGKKRKQRLKGTIPAALRKARLDVAAMVTGDRLDAQLDVPRTAAAVDDITAARPSNTAAQSSAETVVATTSTSLNEPQGVMMHTENDISIAYWDTYEWRLIVDDSMSFSLYELDSPADILDGADIGWFTVMCGLFNLCSRYNHVPVRIFDGQLYQEIMRYGPEDVARYHFPATLDKLMIPVTRDGHHWLLLIWQSQGQCMVFDSLSGPPDTQMVLEFLTRIFYNDSDAPDLQIRVMDSIKQRRGSVDCGLYILHYIETLLRCLNDVENADDIQAYITEQGQLFDVNDARQSLAQSVDTIIKENTRE